MFDIPLLNPNLGGEGERVILSHPLLRFSHDNSETVKAVTLAFCSIQ